MNYARFSIRIPAYAAELLDAEAAREKRSRTQMLFKILRERYGFNPPIEPLIYAPRKKKTAKTVKP